MAKLAVIKTRQNETKVEDFIQSITDEQQRKDSQSLIAMMEKATKEMPRMWGNSMVGFGKEIYKSPASGREVEWFKIGFSPRKATISLHLLELQSHNDLLQQLGKYKTGAGCLYISKLTDVNVQVLQNIITAAANKNLTVIVSAVSNHKS